MLSIFKKKNTGAGVTKEPSDSPPHLTVTAKTTQADVMDWAHQMVDRGVGRGEIHAYLHKTAERVAQESKGQAFAAERAVSYAAMQFEDEMIKYDSRARELERTDQIEEAIVLYETSLAEDWPWPDPYERLRIIYTKQKKYEDALRVCHAAIAKFGARGKPAVCDTATIEKLTELKNR